MCLIDCKISEIGDKQLAIHGGKLLFNNEEDWAKARFENNEEDVFQYLIKSEKHRFDLEKDLKNISPISSIVISQINETLEKIIKIFPI